MKMYEKQLQGKKQKQENKLLQAKENIEKLSSNDNIINLKSIELVRNYKKKGVNDIDTINSIYALSSLLIHSKLKALNKKDTTFDKNNQTIKNQLGVIQNINGNKYIQLMDNYNKLFKSKYNKNGQIVTTCIDNIQANGIMTSIQNLTDNKAIDLLQDIVCNILDILKKENQKNIKDDYLLKPFKTVILSSTIYKNNIVKNKSLWQYTYTNHIKELLKSISKYIDNQKSIKDTACLYDSKTITIMDNISYTRYQKTFKIAGSTVKDSNNKINYIVSNANMQNLVENIINISNFSKTQLYIFKAYYCNFETPTQICDKLQINENTFNTHIARIKGKIIKSNIFNIQDVEKIKHNQKAKKIKCYKNNVFLYDFDSINKASQFLKIDKSNISKVLKGRRKSVNGYYFTF